VGVFAILSVWPCRRSFRGQLAIETTIHAAIKAAPPPGDNLARGGERKRERETETERERKRKSERKKERERKKEIEKEKERERGMNRNLTQLT
jgi:hypothetical protein